MRDPEEPIESPPMRALRRFATGLPEVEEGESCVNRAFRVRGRSFAFLGTKPDSFRLMVKLTDSLPEAQAAAKARPDAFAVGKHGWTTVTLPHTEKPTKGLLEGWIEESFRHFAPSASTARPAQRRTQRREPVPGGAVAVTNAETQLAGFFARYEPAIAKLGKTLRTKLRARLPGLNEVVYLYDGQGSLVIAYSPTERGYEAVCSLALHPDRVKFFLTGGPRLAKSDPHRLLQGTGKMVRYVAIDKAADFDRAEIEALLTAAMELAKVRPVAGAKGAVIVKAEEQKQRAVRARKAARNTQGRSPRSSGGSRDRSRRT